MAQLSDDCFSGAHGLISLADALDFLTRRLVPITDTENLALVRCRNRILATALTSNIDIPNADNSAVDGYLLHHADLHRDRETTLRIVGRATAGHPFMLPVLPGQALRVMTGAAVPKGPDTIMMQEDCRVTDKELTVPPGIKPGANLRKCGEDARKGDRLIEQGQRLRPQDLAIAAASGQTHLPVRKKLRVKIFSCGDELVALGSNLLAGQTYESNSLLITSCLAAWGAEIEDGGILPDQPSAIKAALRLAARECDLVISSGGVSVGEEDHIKTVLEKLGRIHFWRLAIKPGRPLALGQIADQGRQTLFVGLPGNPVASFVNLIHIIRPIIFLLSGARPDTLVLPHVSAIADFTWKKKPGRREWIRTSVFGYTASGLPILKKFPRDGAGLLTSLTHSDGLAELGEAVTGLEPGDEINFLPFWGMW